jgi:hypothetical protein
MKAFDSTRFVIILYIHIRASSQVLFHGGDVTFPGSIVSWIGGSSSHQKHGCDCCE